MITPPRDNLVRASAGGFELHDSEESMPTIFGHAAVFNQWTTIDSAYEGKFLERIAPGAFRDTIAKNKSNMRMLFNHGQDPQIGDKPIAPIETLEEDATGLAYSGRMLDTSYNRDLIPGLRAGLYGSSFRFRVVKEDLNQRAKKSEFNPDGLPERTIQEAHVMEFGAVTFPLTSTTRASLRFEAFLPATTRLRTFGANWASSSLLSSNSLRISGGSSAGSRPQTRPISNGEATVIFAGGA